MSAAKSNLNTGARRGDKMVHKDIRSYFQSKDSNKQTSDEVKEVLVEKDNNADAVITPMTTRRSARQRNKAKENENPGVSQANISGGNGDIKNAPAKATDAVVQSAVAGTSNSKRKLGNQNTKSASGSKMAKVVTDEPINVDEYAAASTSTKAVAAQAKGKPQKKMATKKAAAPKSMTSAVRNKKKLAFMGGRKPKDCVPFCIQGPNNDCYNRSGKRYHGYISCKRKSRKSWQPLESKIVIRHRENNNVETLSVPGSLVNPILFSLCDKVSKCLLSALMHGTLILPEGATLDTVLFDWPGKNHCANGHRFLVTLRMLLYQPDTPGMGALDTATVFCQKHDDETDKCEVGRAFVTKLCTGNPVLDNGEKHNHCRGCPAFGKCLNHHSTRCRMNKNTGAHSRVGNFGGGFRNFGGGFGRFGGGFGRRRVYIPGNDCCIA